uniref:Caffeoylpyruvate hydrolase n=1 Tax=Neonothopanus nambi TaxID=71958 RepID=CPH_NEONM
MAPISSTWSRLIRFVAIETSLVHIGEPIDATMDVGLARREGKTIQAYEIIGSGSALDLSAQVSKNVLTVRELLMPLSREEIKTVRCLGLNYPVHATEANVAVPKFPNLFYKPVTSLIGPDGLITIPSVVQPPKEHQSDYEAELVIVIGKAAKNVSEDEALDYVLGYTAANDISFRKHQLAVSQWSFSKGFGSLLLTIRMAQTHSGNINRFSRDQIFNVKKTISFLSQGTTLEPGSIILTGTPDGVGFVRNPPLYLKDGDEVMTWIGSGIGTLANTVQEEKTCFASGGHE